MFMAAGVGAYWVAVFHLITHAFFKALLFLGAGSVIHGMVGEQDMRRMGGLRKTMPVTFWTMLIGSLAITGVPGLAGFFSKDEILLSVFGGSKPLYLIGILTVSNTAFYMWRLMLLTFFGEKRNLHHPHEPGLVMTAPLGLLAIGSVVAGWWGTGLEHWLEPVLHTAPAAHEGSLQWVLMGVAIIAAAIGILIAQFAYIFSPQLPKRLYKAFGPLALLAENKWYFDKIYHSIFVLGLAQTGGEILGSFDRSVVDGAVNATGWLTRLASRVSIWWDTWIVDGLVRLTALLAELSSFPVRILQTGLVQSYALIMVAALAAVLGFYWVR